MGLIGFIDDEDNKVTFEECWKRERFGGLPREILFKVYLETAGNARPDGLTVTGLLGCARRTHLERLEPYYENPRFLYARFRGSIVHQILEDTNQLYHAGEIIAEQRYSRQIPQTGIFLSGKIDKYIVATQTLEDYKTLDDVKVSGLMKELPIGHVWQANIYKWILEHQGIIVKNIRINYVGWKYCYTSGERCLISPKWGTPEWGTIAACPVYTESQVVDFIYHRAKDITRTETPPCLPVDERHWCTWCPFKSICWKGGIVPR